MIIYKATNIINGKIYIGLSTKSLKHRKKGHYYNSIKPKSHFHKSLRKYRKEDFTWKVIDTADNIDDLKEMEVAWIAYYNSYNKGYNGTEGGDGTFGKFVSKEARKKMSMIHKGKTITKEHRDKTSASQKGKIIPNETMEKRREYYADRILNRVKANSEKEYSGKVGENSGRAKLSEKDVLLIRELYTIRKFKQKKISEIFGVSIGAISGIVTYRNWRHI